MFVAKYAPDGSYVWSKSFGQGGGIGAVYQTASDAMGNVFVAAGYSAGVVDFGCGALPPAGNFDALLAKLDPMGNCVWSKRFGDAGFQQTSAVAVDALGNVIIAGILGGTVDFGGGPLIGAGGEDVFVAKLDPTGQHLWSKRYGDAQDQVVGGIVVGPTGDIAVVGSFKGTIDFGGNPLTSAGGFDGFVAQLDAEGNQVWSRSFGGSQDDGATSVAVDGAGDVALTGTFRGTADLGGGPLAAGGGADIVVAKYDAAGKHLWSRLYGDALDQFGNGVAFDAAGHLYLSASVNGSVDFGLGPLTSAGGLDTVIAELPR
jgi:hypothetical protein